jgi:thiamine pyrophosphokinase
MSSHHIVRDEQEPALLLWQPGQAQWEQVGELLEWSPRVIVHQQALPEALHWGMKLDAVWAFPEALEQAATAVSHQQPVALHSFASGEALAEVVAWLKSKNQHSLNLLADAAADNYSLLRQLASLQAQLQVQVLSQGWRYSYYSSGAAQKWLPEGSRFNVVFFQHKPILDAARTALVRERLPVLEALVQQAGVVKIAGDSSFWLGEPL